MKLINHIIILSIIINTDGQKFQQEQYPFPPQFQTPSSPILSSDNTIYLPPESSTSMPYFNVNNLKKLPVNFLPPTAIKAPHVYPTPYSVLFSSSHRTDFDEDEIHNNNNINIRRVTIPISQTSKNVTVTDKNTNTQNTAVRESKTIPVNPNYQQRFVNNEKFQTLKQTQIFSTPTPFYGQNSNPASRRMISTSEIQRNDNGIDQVKSASFPNPSYLQPPGVFISSTIEPAIPILRLSNEMDLDGSFSYEALGADQTHYVQHSRMENMGTDKEEQVVEGSYSYVGDNGQTYTVHYIADSNGYRASGDHLPVPPPIPEIIQRAVQYNLAEEAKRPPHLRQTWENEAQDYEGENTDHRYTIAPIRNLFTGRTPEAFSLGLSQNTQGPIIPVPSSQSSLRTNYDTARDQNKSMTSIASIVPQITFFASQGAHNPSSPPQQTVSRIIPTDRPTLPQVMNYEANIKDSEQDANKALWRWQYGINTNENNQNSNKNTISRSSGEGDDIIINFSNMSPEQYTRMMQTQVTDQNTAESNNFVINGKSYINQDKHQEYTKESADDKIIDNFIKNDNFIASQQLEKPNKNDSLIFSGPEIKTISYQSTETPNLLINSQAEDNKYYGNTRNNHVNVHSNIINSQNFAPKPQTITQTYTFEEDVSYEPNKLVAINEDNIFKNKMVTESNQEEIKKFWFENYNNNFNSTNNPTSISTFGDNLYISDFVPNEVEKSEFKPVIDTIFKPNDHYTTTMATTTESIKEVLQDNFFLKNLFKHKNDKINIKDKVKNDEKTISSKPKEQILTYVETKIDKSPKLPLTQQKIQNEVKFSKKIPLDITDVLNFVVMKNQFESAKMKPRSRPAAEFTKEYSQKEPLRFIPTDNDDEEVNHKSQNLNNVREKDKDHRHHQEHTVVKNYKTLQRHKHTGQNLDHQYVQESYRNVKTFPIQNLPPLGRAGPSLKTYLPPTYL